MKKPLLLAAAALCAACYDTHIVRPTELKNLDGFDVHNERTVYTPVMSTTSGTTVRGVFHPGTTSVNNVAQKLTDRPYVMLDSDGEPVEYNSTRDLTVVTRGGGTGGGRFASFKVDGEHLEGALLKGGDVNVKLAELDHAEIKTYNPTKTTLALCAPLLAALPLVFIFVVPHNN